MTDSRTAILGLGLMGGSIAMGLRARGYEGTITGYARRPETLARALQGGMIDEGGDDAAAVVADADLVILGVPILTMGPLLKACLPGLKPGAVVTDVGSTKACLADELPRVLSGSGAEFVGSHPIAGSEQQGLEAATSHLYDEAVVVVTPVPASDVGKVRKVRAFWEGLGSRVVEMAPTEHDALLARTSHLPHLGAAGLSLAVGRDGAQLAGLFCGSGFDDATRIAAGSPDVWLDILRTNREALLEELPAFIQSIQDLQDLMRSSNWEAVHAWLQKAGAARTALLDVRRRGWEDPS